MIIQVLGSGCPTCKSLYERTQEAVSELNLKAEVEYITDISKIIEMGIMFSPVLALDGKALISGKLPSVEEIKKVLQEAYE